VYVRLLHKNHRWQAGKTGKTLYNQKWTIYYTLLVRDSRNRLASKGSVVHEIDQSLFLDTIQTLRFRQRSGVISVAAEVIKLPEPQEFSVSCEEASHD